MTRLIAWRTTGIAVLIGLAMASVVQAQQPTVVFSIRGIDPLLDDADFIGNEVGHPGVKAHATQFVDNFTGGKGLAGIDRKKPLGVYWNAKADGPPHMPVAFIPVSDAAALKELVMQLAPDFEDDNGEWSASVGDTKLFGKVSGGYLFISPNLPAKLPDAAKLTNGKYDIALDVSIASVPQPLKDMFLAQVEEAANRAREQRSEPANEAERIGEEFGHNFAMSVFKAIANDGDKLTLGVEIDQKARIGAVDYALTAKPNSGMAKVMAAYGKIQPAFAGIGSESAPFRITWSQPTPGSAEEIDKFFAAVRPSLMNSIKEKSPNGELSEFEQKLADRMLDLAKSTLKSGSLHAGVVLESGGNEMLRVIGGAKVAKGEELGKLLDDIVKHSKNNPDAEKLKLDVAKHAGARIHAVSVATRPEDNFGDGPAHLAFGADSFWFAMGGDNLTALKNALDAKPNPRAARAPISMQFKPAALMILFKDRHPEALETAKTIVGKPGDTATIEVAPISNGAKLRIEFGVDLLKFAHQNPDDN